jgi:hypothetical protein
MAHASGTLALAAAGPARSQAASGDLARPALPAFYDDLEERTFRWFWELVNRENGLVPDRWPTPSFCSIAAVGFALTAYPIGVERGWCSRKDARDLTLTTLRFFWNAPQGAAEEGVSGHKGFFYHFLDMKTGLRFEKVELSSVDTTILFMGMLFAAGYFDRSDPEEVEIRRLAASIYERADWEWFRQGAAISMGWHPDRGFIERGWTGYNEAMMVLVLALGSPTRPVRTRLWEGWTATYPASWWGQGASRHLAFGPLFGHQYSHVWIDFRGIRDAVMRKAGFDYFENSRRATYAARAYCIANPLGWRGYSKDVWGLTACDGPGNFDPPAGGAHKVRGYSARGPIDQPDGFDDGTIAPTAAVGCLPFAPEIVIPCAEAMHRDHGRRIFAEFGFLDAFNPSFTAQGVKLERGVAYPRHGWVDSDYLGIDQGPILAMAANYRSDFIWKIMRRSPVVRRGLTRAGFTGGWLAA